MNKEELFNFLDYLEDKIEDCYKAEVKKAIENFKKRVAKENE